MPQPLADAHPPSVLAAVATTVATVATVVAVSASSIAVRFSIVATLARALRGA
tara:strand:+ start:723 stop:881 length:159 start_codon:yes stop_codon:yes gene_type:complete